MPITKKTNNKGRLDYRMGKDFEEIIIKELIRKDVELYRVKSYYDTISQIVSLGGKNTILQFLKENGYNKIVIYGAGTLGKIFYDSIKDAYDEITIVDNNQASRYDYDEKNVVSVESLMNSNFDIVIITPLFAFETIKETLGKLDIRNYISVQEIFLNSFLYVGEMN
ncbi:MAG: hypothetical protein FWH52_01385 [Synergistaceae bacterium]|nr:hypothetical protein [Synergistaceae bacterium]